MSWVKQGNLKGEKGADGADATPAPNRVSGQDSSGPRNLTLWVGTLGEFDAIPVKDSTTVYVVKD